MPTSEGVNEITSNNREARAGSLLLHYDDSTQLTDAAPSYTKIVGTRHINRLLVDVVSAKGCTVVITPLLSLSSDTELGKPSDTGTLANGGPAGRFAYANLAAPRARVVVTKTQAGSTTGFKLAIRGE